MMICQDKMAEAEQMFKRVSTERKGKSRSWLAEMIYHIQALQTEINSTQRR